MQTLLKFLIIKKKKLDDVKYLQIGNEWVLVNNMFKEIFYENK